MPGNQPIIKHSLEGVFDDSQKPIETVSYLDIRLGCCKRIIKPVLGNISVTSGRACCHSCWNTCSAKQNYISIVINQQSSSVIHPSIRDVIKKY